jgi:hypothetical protein
MSAAPAAAVPATDVTINTLALHASPTIALNRAGEIEMVNTRAS